MDKSRGKIPKALMRPFGIIGVDISANLISGRLFIGIAADDVDLLLFDSAKESFCEGIIGGSAYPGKTDIGSHEGKELYCHPGRIGRSPIYP